MATKKTVKKAPAVVKATPETREVGTDGEYNKYPKYHGCLRFDDDNIFEITKDDAGIRVLYNNEVVYPPAPSVPEYDFSDGENF